MDSRFTYGETEGGEDLWNFEKISQNSLNVIFCRISCDINAPSNYSSYR